MLYSIAKENGASEDILNFLLTAEAIENQQRERFIPECVADEDRIEKTIKKILNFEPSSAKKNYKSC